MFKGGGRDMATKEKRNMTLEEFCNFTPKQMMATQAADTHKYVLFGGSR